jgi:predicted amidohydrolase YtcJ
MSKEVIDLKGRYVLPGFIDAHLHIESSMVSPIEFARAVKDDLLLLKERLRRSARLKIHIPANI